MSGAVVGRKHVLRMRRVTASPGLVRPRVHLPRPVVTLVECDGDQSPLRGAFSSLCVIVLEDACGDGGHAFLGLEPWVEEPEAGEGGGGWGELVETVDGAEEAGDGESFVGDSLSGGGGRGSLIGGVGRGKRIGCGL